MLNPPVPIFKKSCPVALVVEMLTVMLPPSPSRKPTLNVTVLVAL